MISLRKKNDLAYYGILCILDFYHFFIIKKLINFPSRSTGLFNNKTYLSPLSTTLLQGLCLFNGPFELVAFGKKLVSFSSRTLEPAWREVLDMALATLQSQNHCGVFSAMSSVDPGMDLTGVERE